MATPHAALFFWKTEQYILLLHLKHVQGILNFCKTFFFHYIKLSIIFSVSSYKSVYLDPIFYFIVRVVGIMCHLSILVTFFTISLFHGLKTAEGYCRYANFKCQDGRRCIPSDKFCDGRSSHCRSDGSDEILYNHTMHSDKGIPCRNKKYENIVCFLPNDQAMKREFLCAPTVNCTKYQFECPVSGRCLKGAFCNSYPNCGSGEKSDEIKYDHTKHSDKGIPCTQGNLVCLLPNDQAYKKDTLCAANPKCGNNSFQCVRSKINPSPCIAWNRFCDGQEDCWDGSDEIATVFLDNFDGIPCENPRNRRSCMLPRNYVCDDFVHCANGEDEAFCQSSEQIQTVYSDGKHFRCLDRLKIIGSHQVCDGIIHCTDLSDECFCFNSHSDLLLNQICQEILYGQSYVKNDSCATLKTICNGNNDCENAMDEKFCESKNAEVCSDKPDAPNKCDFECGSYDSAGLGIVGVRAKKCNGRGECRFGLDREECKECAVKPKFCRRIQRNTHVTTVFQCTGAFNPLPCDGIKECSDYSDELDCPERFYCRKDPPEHIAMDKACDLRKDCSHSEDELHCHNYTICDNRAVNDTSYCKPTHFYCDNQTFIDARKVCNGDNDCASGIDECQGCFKIFSNDQFMIKYPWMVPVMWAIGLVAVIGNGCAIGLTCHSSVKNRRKSSVLQKSQTIVLLNLSVGDFIVGVYILAICILNETLSQDKYCLRDQEWRSSSACSILGVLVMAGSEQSVFMLAIITAIRLRSILKPFKKLSLKLVMIMSGISWILSIGLAIFPLLPQTADYFTEKVWFANNSFVSYVHQSNLSEYNKRLVTYSNENVSSHDLTSWETLKNFIKMLNVNYIPEREFGYYTKYSVCLPRLFPDPAEDKTWGYTFALIVTNFLGFVWIAVGYLIIYYKSTRPNVQRTSNAAVTAKLQRKITMIVFTDLLCWVPIAILGFLKMSGVHIPPGLYAAIGVILVPINSAINPFLYSDIASLVWKRIQRCVQGLRGSLTRITSARAAAEQHN